MDPTTTTTSTRRAVAADRLGELRATRPEHRAQRYDDWLQIATPREVRRAWRAWMGAWPGWAGERPADD